MPHFVIVEGGKCIKLEKGTFFLPSGLMVFLMAQILSLYNFIIDYEGLLTTYTCGLISVFTEIETFGLNINLKVRPRHPALH